MPIKKLEVLIVFRLTGDELKDAVTIKRSKRVFKYVYQMLLCHRLNLMDSEPRIFGGVNPRIEFPVLIPTSDEKPSDIVKFLRKVSKELLVFAKNIQQITLPHWSIDLPAESGKNGGERLLASSFTAHHPNVGLSAFSFGNIIEHSQHVEHLKEEALPKGKYVWIPMEEQTMKVDFEHDRQTLFIRFYYSPKSAVQSNVIDKVSLMIRYSAIRQIYWEILETPGGGLRYQIHLRLLYPPIVKRTSDVFGIIARSKKNMQNISNSSVGPNKNFKLAGKNKNAHRKKLKIDTSFLEGVESVEVEVENTNRKSELRCHDGSWDEKRNEISDAVRDSPILTLEFLPEANDTVFTVLGRLQDLLKFTSGHPAVEIRNFVPKTLPRLDNIFISKTFYEDFDLIYILEGLKFECGRILIDCLVTEEDRRRFFGRILAEHKQNRKRTLYALEKLLQDLSGRKEVPPGGLMAIFNKKLGLFNVSAGRYLVEAEEFEREGYCFVRRLTITPTRLVYGPRELIMGNRVLRHDPENFPPEKFLRVIFRDEDLSKMLVGNGVHYRLIDNIIGERVRKGIWIGGRYYLCIGSSNSQLRDGGCYFVQVGKPRSEQEFRKCYAIDRFRRSLGQFSPKSVPKMMARLGQSFTQAQETKICVSSQLLGADFLGSLNKKGESYILSDGCGGLSLAAARIIAEELELNPDSPPSCFQFRYAGYKGVLVVNPKLDEALEKFTGEQRVCKCFSQQVCKDEEEARQFLMERIPCIHQTQEKAVHFYFRPSQLKFDVTVGQKEKCRLEIVKYSAQTPANIGRQLVNILDQVTQSQSPQTHSRLSARLHALLDRCLSDIYATLTKEADARRKLREFPKFLDYTKLLSTSLTTEPFFQRILRANAQLTLDRLRQRALIPLPGEKARIAFGVIDETGFLRPGQVFFQYTTDLWDREPGWEKRNSLHKGRVLITKYPCVVAGDARMFEAVDVPDLRHLVNVLVFPRTCSRPHSDEMAGSDLDGDEYFVCWDSDLFIDRNEPAFDYTAPPQTENIVPKDAIHFQDKMAIFMVDYMAKDSIGRIANAHIIHSDLYSIKTETSLDIAQKHSQAVDFQKTGVPPEKLRHSWVKNKPPERFERAPDFMEKQWEPQYLSQRLNGQLFRKIREASGAVQSVISEASNEEIKPDESFLFKPPTENEEKEGTEEDDQKKAALLYERYANTVQKLMDIYGIESEGELFSSSFVALKSQSVDREIMENTFFNTARMVQKQLKDIVRKARTEFFKYFGGQHQNVINSSDAVKRFASACYKYTYSLKDDKTKFFSFPWAICYDVLDEIHRKNVEVKSSDNNTVPIEHLCHISGYISNHDPFGALIARNIEAYIESGHQLSKFEAFVANELTPSSFPIEIVSQNRDFGKLLFTCVEWARGNGLIKGESNGNVEPFSSKSMCWVVIAWHRFHLKMTLSSNMKTDGKPTERVEGTLFLAFLEFFSSHGSRNHVDSLDFTGCLGLVSILSLRLTLKKEWSQFRKLASDAYHRLVFTGGSLDRVLPLGNGTNGQDNLLKRPLLETVFSVEVPDGMESSFTVNAQRLCKALCQKSGCVAICFREDPYSMARKGSLKLGDYVKRAQIRNYIPAPIRLYVSCWGEREAAERLREFFMVTPRLDPSSATLQRETRTIPQQSVEKIRALSPEIASLIQQSISVLDLF